MAKSKNQKKEIVDNYAEEIKKSKAFYVVKTYGIGPNDVNELRRELRKLDSKYSLVKNSLFSIALKEQDLDVPEEMQTEQHAVLFSSEQVSESAKVLKNFLQDRDNNEIQFGYLDKTYMNREKVMYLATLPTKEELYAKLVGTLTSPVRGFLNGLTFNVRGLINVLNAIKETK